MEKNKKTPEVLKTALNILYPRRCPVCHRILRDQKNLICPECEGVFQPITEDYCLKCGSPVKPEEEYCRDCAGQRRSFDEGRGIFLYDQKMKKSLIRYKYYGCREYADYYALSMYRYGRRNILRWKPDVIIPVPLHRRKLRMRGFNQAGFLAERLGMLLDIPVSEKAGRRGEKEKSAAGFSGGEKTGWSDGFAGRRCLYHRKHCGIRSGMSERSRRGKGMLSHSVHGTYMRESGKNTFHR